MASNGVSTINYSGSTGGKRTSEAASSAFGGVLLAQVPTVSGSKAPNNDTVEGLIKILNDAINEFYHHPNAIYAKKINDITARSKSFVTSKKDSKNPKQEELKALTGVAAETLAVISQAKNIQPKKTSQLPSKPRTPLWIGNKKEQQVLRFDVTIGSNKGKVGVQADKGQVLYYPAGTPDSKIRQELADPKSLLAQNAAFKMGYAPVKKVKLPSGQIVKIRPNNTGERIVAFDEKGVARDFRSLDEIQQSKFFGGRKGDNLDWKRIALANGTQALVAKDGKKTVVTTDFETSPNGEIRATENAKFRNFAGNTSDVAIQNSVALGQTKIAAKPTPDTLPTAPSPSATSGEPSSPLKTNGLSKTKEIAPVAPVDDFRVGALADVTMFGFDRPLSRLGDLTSVIFPAGKAKEGVKELTKLQEFLKKHNGAEDGSGADPLRLEFNTALTGRGLNEIGKNIVPIYVHYKLNVEQAIKSLGPAYEPFKKTFYKFLELTGISAAALELTKKLINTQEKQIFLDKLKPIPEKYRKATDIRVTAYYDNNGLKYIAPGYMHVSPFNLIPGKNWGKKATQDGRKIKILAYDSVRFLIDTKTGKLKGTLVLLGLYFRTVAKNKSMAWMGFGPAVPIVIPANGDYANTNLRKDKDGHYGFLTNINGAEKFVRTPKLIDSLKQFGGNFSGIRTTKAPSIDFVDYLTSLTPDVGSRIRQMQETVQNFGIVENGADIATSAMTIAAVYEGFRVLAPKTATTLEGKVGDFKNRQLERLRNSKSGQTPQKPIPKSTRIVRSSPTNINKVSSDITRNPNFNPRRPLTTRAALPIAGLGTGGAAAGTSLVIISTAAIAFCGIYFVGNPSANAVTLDDVILGNLSDFSKASKKLNDILQKKTALNASDKIEIKKLRENIKRFIDSIDKHSDMSKRLVALLQKPAKGMTTQQRETILAFASDRTFRNTIMADLDKKISERA
jgi:hypothetical protein